EAVVLAAGELERAVAERIGRAVGGQASGGGRSSRRRAEMVEVVVGRTCSAREFCTQLVVNAGAVYARRYTSPRFCTSISSPSYVKERGISFGSLL
nr:hypothetical protein [Pyrinomonadaceae bacterium]